MEEENREAAVSFFEGRARVLWCVALAVSTALAAAGWLLVFLLPPRAGEAPDYTINIIFTVVAVAATGVLLVCIVTAKMRTSKWKLDKNGVSYSAFGIRLMTLEWEEVKEAGFLKITNPRSGVTAYYLYWTSEQLMSACRNFIRGGAMEHKPKYLGKYNRPKGSIVLYAIDPNDPANDPLVVFTQANYPHPLKNPKVLDWAVTAAAEN